MTIESVAETLAGVAVWGSLAPVIIGSIRSIRRPSEERAALMWMLVALVMNLWLELSQAAGARTTSSLEIARGLYAVTGMYALAELIGTDKGRTWISGGLVAYLGWWLWRVSEADYALPFAQYSGPALYLVLAIAATGLVMVRLRASPPTPMRDFGVLIGLGAVISYAPAVAIDAVSQLFIESNPDAILALWALRGAFLVVGLVLFSLAFLWTIPPRSSSGLSHSAP